MEAVGVSEGEGGDAPPWMRVPTLAGIVLRNFGG